jgi:hypothetical protein
VQDVFDLSFTETVTYTRGRHNVHAGVQEDDIHGNIIQPQFSPSVRLTGFAQDDGCALWVGFKRVG